MHTDHSYPHPLLYSYYQPPDTHFLTNLLSISCLFILIRGPLRLVVDEDCIESVVIV